tara:strand:+ start:2939 stop:3382 length:444 start_codon:yes stop_codon:yes gene_type:complete
MNSCIQLKDFSFRILILPYELSLNIEEVLEFKMHEKYKQNIFQGSFILDIKSFKYNQLAYINNDASITFNIVATCEVLFPEEGKHYEIKFNNVNKMGAFCKFSKVTIFVPKHSFKNQELPNINDILNVEILGKRVEENLVCVAKPVY